MIRKSCRKSKERTHATKAFQPPAREKKKESNTKKKEKRTTTTTKTKMKKETKLCEFSKESTTFFATSSRF
jgi:hypothetical protein